MVPPAALCVHLCIGQAYAFSVFNLPMTKLLGITESTSDDWKLTDLGWIFSLAIFFLGVSSAVFDRWVEEGAPSRCRVMCLGCLNKSSNMTGSPSAGWKEIKSPSIDLLCGVTKSSSARFTQPAELRAT